MKNPKQDYEKLKGHNSIIQSQNDFVQANKFLVMKAPLPEHYEHHFTCTTDTTPINSCPSECALINFLLEFESHWSLFSNWALTFAFMHFTSVSPYSCSCKMSHSSPLMYQMTSGTLLHEFINRMHQLEKWLLMNADVQARQRSSSGNVDCSIQRRRKRGKSNIDQHWKDQMSGLTQRCRLVDQLQCSCQESCVLSTRGADTCALETASLSLFNLSDVSFMSWQGVM